MLESVSLTVQPGQRVAIVGANGAGKSSLFQLLLGQLAPEQGTVSLPGGCRIAHMAQEVEALVPHGPGFCAGWRSRICVALKAELA